jgi:uncharacterized damage-inducible protein DinB/predicted RNase H-like HicB family nuclease
MKDNKYKIYLEVDRKGWCMAHVEGLPGCFVWDKTTTKTLRRLPDAIKDFLSFLRKHGERNLKIPKKVKSEIVETKKGTCPVWSGSKAALFSCDLIPPSNDFIRKCLRWMRYNRVELLSEVGKLSQEVLDWKPDKKTRSIRETLNHIANAEWWYLSRLKDFKELYKLPEYSTEETFERLKRIRELAVHLLKTLSPTDRKRINIPKKYARYKDEKWTAGKVLRRFLEHEREHIDTIEKTLTLYKTNLKK